MTDEELQRAIADQAARTYAPPRGNLEVGIRLNQDVADLLRALARDDRSYIALNMANIYINLSWMAERLGMNLHEEVDIRVQSMRLLWEAHLARDRQLSATPDEEAEERR